MENFSSSVTTKAGIVVPEDHRVDLSSFLEEVVIVGWRDNGRGCSGRMSFLDLVFQDYLELNEPVSGLGNLLETSPNLR